MTIAKRLNAHEKRIAALEARFAELDAALAAEDEAQDEEAQTTTLDGERVEARERDQSESLG